MAAAAFAPYTAGVRDRHKAKRNLANCSTVGDSEPAASLAGGAPDGSAGSAFGGWTLSPPARQMLLELWECPPGLAADGGQRAGCEFSVERDDHGPTAVRVAEFEVAATLAAPFKPGPLQRRHQRAAGHHWGTGAHAGTRTSIWVTSGGSVGGAAGTSSKYSSSASLRLARAFSTVLPWLATSTSRQRATYQSPSLVTAAVSRRATVGTATS